MKAVMVANNAVGGRDDVADVTLHCLRVYLEKSYREALDLFDIAYRRVWADQWFIAADPERLALIPPERTTESDAYHRRLGRFFGYPPDAIEAFLPIQTRSPYPRDLVANGSVTATQIAYTRFVPYVLATPVGATTERSPPGRRFTSVSVSSHTNGSSQSLRHSLRPPMTTLLPSIRGRRDRSFLCAMRHTTDSDHGNSRIARSQTGLVGHELHIASERTR